MKATLSSEGSAFATAALRSSGLDLDTATILVATSLGVWRLSLRSDEKLLVVARTTRHRIQI